VTTQSGPRLGAARERLDAEPGGPALTGLEVVVVGPELEDEPLVDVAQVVGGRGVAVGVAEEGVRERRVLRVVRGVVRHR
jgi:hypothetical protein